MSQKELAQGVLDKYVYNLNLSLAKVLRLFKDFNIPNWQQFKIEEEIGFFKWVWKHGDFEFIFQMRPCVDLGYVYVNERNNQREILEEENLEKSVTRLRCFMNDHNM